MFKKNQPKPLKPIYYGRTLLGIGVQLQRIRLREKHLSLSEFYKDTPGSTVTLQQSRFAARKRAKAAGKHFARIETAKTLKAYRHALTIPSLTKTHSSGLQALA